MREYKKIKMETEELTKVLCDTCKKEIHKCVSGGAYIPPDVITVSRKYSIYWGQDTFDFCSLECFLEWAKGEVDVFNVCFPSDALNTLASEYARLKSRDSRLTALENSNTEIKEEKRMIKNIIYVEDGSVDLDELKSTLTPETKIIVYRQGSNPPILVQPQVPIDDIFSEAEFTGNRNTRDFNPGYSNTVNGNTGIFNIGNSNAGNRNTGYGNTGNCNTGNCNTGDCNTGHRNTGNCNTGNCNTGDCNTGYRNAGNFNTGHFNACNYSSGFFCTEEPKARVFNKEIDISVPEFRDSKYYRALFSSPFPLTEEIDGKFVKYNYKEACAKWWAGMSEENKKIVKSIPNFDAEIFEEITGIKEVE